jgi:Spy/CpxP family protein refolding chaperone
MHRASPRRTPILRFLLPAALLLAACDRELESPEPQGDRAAEAAPADGDGSHAERAHHRGKGHKLERLCEKLECTDEQLVKIEGLADRLYAEHPEPAGDRDAANRALATAFAGDGFSTADLQAYHSATRPEADEMDALLVEAVGELHGILDATQRATLADKIEKRGLPFLGGKGGKHHGKRGGDDHAAKKTERLCGAVACTEEQRAQITELVQAQPEGGEVPEADRTALAQAFRGESLSDEAVTAYLEAAAKARVAELAARDAQTVQLHGLLTPQQRATLAEQIGEHGPKALLGKGRGDHGGKKHRGGKKGKRGEGPRGEAQQFG